MLPEVGRGAFIRLTRVRRPRIGQPLINHKQPVIKYDEASFNERLIACQLISSGENGVSRVPMARKQVPRDKPIVERSRRFVDETFSTAKYCATPDPGNTVSFRKRRQPIKPILHFYETLTRRRKRENCILRIHEIRRID